MDAVNAPAASATMPNLAARHSTLFFPPAHSARVLEMLHLEASDSDAPVFRTPAEGGWPPAQNDCGVI